jgi:hypothetical protein
LLRSAAEALDGLFARCGIAHLGLHPRNVLVDGQAVRVADFGLLPLVWLPTGQPASAVNGKYAAPELFDQRPSRSADQYSLALIYAEMLTGIHPRSRALPSKRAGEAEPGSGLHRRPGSMGTSPSLTATRPRSGAQRVVKIDLDLVPGGEREVVARALSNDPDRRFPSCLAFVEALESAVGAASAASEFLDAINSLPAVIPFASLLGEPPPPDVVLPTPQQLVTVLTTRSQESGVRSQESTGRSLRTPDPGLLSPETRKVHGPQNSRYFIQSDGSWEYRCPMQLFPGAMQLKVAGFCQHWNGRVVRHTGDSYRVHVEMPAPRGFWERFKQPNQLEEDIEAESLVSGQTRLTEARVRVRYLAKGRDKSDRVLATMAPQLFDSIRLYFQATPEQRTLERWSFTAPVRTYPVLPGLELAATLDGVCQNISFGGIRFLLPERPPSDHLYLHLHSSSAALAYALLVHVLRLQETIAGVEIGARFATAAPQG